MIDDQLASQIGALARTPQLLVACDYDGTLAPIVGDPDAAYPNRDCIVALRNLAALAQTEVAVISGRSLRDLAALSRLPEEVHLVGSHGSEFDVDFARSLAPEVAALRTEIGASVSAIAQRYPLATVEQKPTAVAFHYRQMSDADADAALAELHAGPASIDGVHLREGKKVCELLLSETNKGIALDAIRTRVSATTVIFLGDDRTDEDAFGALRGPDVGVKVGQGETLAGFRVDDVDDVAQLLASLLEERTAWLSGEGLVPIEAHSILSDQRTIAITTPSARISWFCAPRIDSSAMFAELLGGPSAGYFAAGPSDGAAPTGQRYLGDSLVLETAWSAMTVTDYLDVSDGRVTHTAGRTDLIRVLEGNGMARIDFAPRLNFGRTFTQVESRDDGLVVTGSQELIALRSPGVEWNIVDDGMHQSARATIDLSAGPVVLELRCGTASLRPDVRAEGDRRRNTAAWWSNWAASLELPSVATSAVRRSAVLLRSLVQGPTGAIAAAATTSLPEHLGGIRNWDYRYCWLRDAALTASALVELGSTAEAMEYLDWVLALLDRDDTEPERLQPLYQVNGADLPPEAEIGELAGYAGSRPVRIGNAADHQVQLDVFGPVVDLVERVGRRGAPLSGRHWALVEAMVQAVETRWEEPDNGIWEIRAAPRHHVYSRLMCWVTVDRAIRIGDEFFGQDRPDWMQLRDEIATDILSNGWNDEADSYTAAYDGTDLDSSVLAIGLWGLVDPMDPKYVSTVAAVERDLREGTTVYRYLHDDGLPGAEGGFNLMTSWLVDALEATGQHDRADELFRAYLRLAGPTGLMAEEVDADTGRSLGNVPQAYTHLGVIMNAVRLAARDTQNRD